MSDIYAAIAAVMHDVGYVSKDSYNEGQRYKFRGIDATMNAMHPAMVKNGVFVTPEILEMSREERAGRNGGILVYSIAKVRYTFYTADGSSVTATVMGEGMDSGDKSMNKAMSAAYKYALFQTFCIPTEEMIDSEQDNPEPTKDRKKAKKPTQVKEEQAIPVVTNETVKAAVAEIDPNMPLTEKQVQQLRAVCESHNMPEAQIFTMYGRESIEAMTQDDWGKFGRNGKQFLADWDAGKTA